MADVAVARTDRVTVADWRSVQGLERRVLVWMTCRSDEDRLVYHGYRLFAWSRCTTQLLRLGPPPDGTDSKNGDSTDPSRTPREHNAGDEDETTEERQP